MAHSWKAHTCRVCGLERRVNRPAGRYHKSNTTYVYQPKDVSYASHICPPCNDGQIALFEKYLPPEPPPPAPEAKESIARGVQYERPVRDPSPVTLTVSDTVSLEMDGDGRWGGHSAWWYVGALMPPNMLPIGEPYVKLHDTFPVVLDQVEAYMRRYSGMGTVKVFARDRINEYVWTLDTKKFWRLQAQKAVS